VPALLRAAGGRPSDALRLAASGQSPKAWGLLPKAMLRGDVAALADHAPAQAISALQKLCHDLMATDSGAAPRFFEAADLPAVPPKVVLARWSKSLANAAKTAEHPFNAGLMLEALVSEARSTLNSAGRRP
jgi:DNA polymerase-3 subunit delta'